MITRQRWHRIKDVFNLALTQPAGERTKFISEACDGDDSLRQEVESLISAHEGGDNFLDAPAHELAAEMLTGDSMELVAGQQLGPYTILSSLGFGGMGEVYLARDVRLDRKIALKLLGWEFARDADRVRRFEQEARAASALNHPNVCVIHEIDKTEDGRHFMAMEFIDGITLRSRMTQKRLSLKEVLDVGVQVAGALEAAHAAGIVHRDIKPENIMLRRDGYVKVLDFGIAKLNAHPPRLREAHETETVPHLHTAPGTLMGTAKYMSPEQLREQPVDQRSDIWSLGVVLHELVTGFTPFEAPSTNDTIAIILEKQPARLGFHTGGVPEEFQQLVKKALSKKRSERYETISQLGSDLRKLRRQISAGTATEQLEPLTQSFVTTGGVGTGVAVSTGFSRVKSQALWTAEYVLSEIKQHKTAAVFTGVTAVFALLFIAFGSPGLFSRRPSASPAATMRPTPMMTSVVAKTQLTNTGKPVCAAISPDGNYVAYAEKDKVGQRLVIKEIETTSRKEIVRSAEVIYLGLTFSRDSMNLYFVRTEGESKDGVLYQVARSGGAPKKIMDDVDSPISFSHDGKRFAFVRSDQGSDVSALVIALLDGSSERKIAVKPKNKPFSIYGPAWSPDGESVVTGVGSWDDGYYMELVEINVADGQEKTIGGRSWYSVRQVGWSEDSGLIISAKEEPLSLFQLWRIPYPQGQPINLTNELAEYDTVSLAGNKIVAMRTIQEWEISTSPGGDVQRAKPIRDGNGRSYGLNWTSSGKILFAAMAGANGHIFRIDADGSNQIQLTDEGGANYMPAASQGGSYVVFSSYRNRRANIWRMNEDGSDKQQLTFSDGNYYPSCSLDGWVFYENQENPSSPTTIWKVPIEGGDAIQVTNKPSHKPMVSPDGRFIACRYYDPKYDSKEGIAILRSAGGEPVQFVRLPIQEWQRIQWTPDSRALTYIKIEDGVSNIWSWDLASDLEKQLTYFKSDQIFAYGWSSDFKLLAAERGSRSSDVTLLINP